MFRSEAIFILCGIFINYASSHSLFKYEKCSIKDNECIKKSVQAVIQEAAESGIPDTGVPILDPFKYKDVNATLMGMIQFLSQELTVAGLKTCVLADIHVEVGEKQAVSAKYICELVNVEGDYNIQPTQVLNALTGGLQIHGEGKGSLVIEKIQYDVNIPFLIKKLDDSELHVVVQGDQITYEVDILGNAKLAADNLFVGNQDISAVAVKIANENWKILAKIFSKTVSDIAMSVFVENANKYSAAVPIKEIIAEDLSAYATE